MRPFFILSLPRTRTAWLANLLTHDGVFAWHEGLLGCASLADVGAKLARPRADVVGMVDGSAALIRDRLAGEFPTARWVVLRGDPLRSWQRLRRILPAIPLAALLRLDDSITAAADAPGTLTLPIADAYTGAGVQRILDHIAPGKRLDAVRFDALRDVNVRVDDAALRDRITSEGARIAALFAEETP